MEEKSTKTHVALKKDELLYTSCYCEENVYMMCKTMSELNRKEEDHSMLDHCTVVFISNPSKSIPIWKQKNSPDGPVDYHVILYYHNYDTKEFYVYDMDTVLPFPCDATEYVMLAFHPELQLQERFKRCFRLVPGSVFLREFASDRSHMLEENGEYMKPPPEYPAIASTDDVMNLPRYIDMTENTVSPEKFGVVIDEQQFFTTVLAHVQMNVAAS
ncbi:protein N-terminal glutamine amidohydrolase [Zychaea mexicana]|uniref:protein N-terminal glutamine amidohydrolase n=1 Tax=Zychaea mexicana TaxID=64656 RepID=UPI0022FEC9BC|nr:protein N-terminal glutamine amidohydrolase [Zychaea mexicana]KAI9489482.1 protein N-terminal glutamine amidohydrolase [Zychaea mexicana]